MAERDAEGRRSVIVVESNESDDVLDSSWSTTLLPLRFLGMGLLITWLCCTHLPDMYVSLWGETVRTSMDYSLRIGDVGTFVIVAFCAAMLRGRKLSSRRVLCVAMLAICAAGTAAMPLICVLCGSSASLFIPVAAIPAGAGGAVLFLLWGEVYGCLGPYRCVSYGAASCVVAGVAALIIARTDALAQIVLISALPIMSGALALASIDYLDAAIEPARKHIAIAEGELAGEKGADNASATGRSTGSDASRIRAAKSSYPIPWKIIALMAFAGFASSFAGNVLIVYSDHPGAVHRIVATTIVGIVILAVLAARKGNGIDTRVLAWATLPLAIIAIAAIPTLGYSAGIAVSFLVKLAYVMFTFFSLTLVASIVWRYEVPSDFIFACARASSEGAMFCGILARQAMTRAEVFDSQNTLWIITLVGMLAIIGCVLLWHRESTVNSGWGALSIDTDSGRHVPSKRERIIRRCDELASECGLTQRETEVLTLVAQGLDASEVESALYVSHNTLKTHLRHLYAKLGVHTREELEQVVLADETSG
jgi:DNA-binding CsgD family transcriptional regulator